MMHLICEHEPIPDRPGFTRPVTADTFKACDTNERGPCSVASDCESEWSDAIDCPVCLIERDRRRARRAAAREEIRARRAARSQ